MTFGVNISQYQAEIIFKSLKLFLSVLHSNNQCSLWCIDNREFVVDSAPANLLVWDCDVSLITAYFLGFQKPSWLKKFVSWCLHIWLCLSILYFSILRDSTVLLLYSTFCKWFTGITIFSSVTVKKCLQRGSSSPWI